MRAYHRVDPLMDERKGHYTPAQFGAFLKVQLVAGRQTKRGSFRSVAALKAMLPGPYAKHVDHLIAEGDLDLMADGTVYLDGWNEWQEGDLTVRDRMARLRNRQRNNDRNQAVPEPSQRTGPPPSPQTPLPPPHVGDGVGVGVDGPPADEPEPEWPALTWLANHGCYVRPGNGYHQHLVTATQSHGVDALIGAMERLAKLGTKQGDVKGFVFGAIDALNAKVRPNVRELEKADAQAASSKRATDSAARTKVRIHDSGYHVDVPDPACPRCAETNQGAA